jgi:hypothetical protein
MNSRRIKHKLTITRFLIALFHANTRANIAEIRVKNPITNRKSDIFEETLAASRISFEYKISMRIIPKKIVISQPYNPTKKEPMCFGFKDVFIFSPQLISQELQGDCNKPFDF